MMTSAGIEIPQEIHTQREQGNQMAQQNPLTSFIYSMLPWVNPIANNNNNNNNNNNQNNQNNDNNNNDNNDNDMDEID